MPFLSKVSNIVQNIFYVYDVTDFTQLWHLIPVTTKCTVHLAANRNQMPRFTDSSIIVQNTLGCDKYQTP
jgi:hypothetical protein